MLVGKECWSASGLYRGNLDNDELSCGSCCQSWGREGPRSHSSRWYVPPANKIVPKKRFRWREHFESETFFHLSLSMGSMVRNIQLAIFIRCKDACICACTIWILYVWVNATSNCSENNSVVMDSINNRTQNDAHTRVPKPPSLSKIFLSCVFPGRGWRGRVCWPLRKRTKTTSSNTPVSVPPPCTGGGGICAKTVKQRRGGMC